ncbi:hypothetical protein [Microbacterium aurantiacum]|uniref:Uncharacterized protein n=1 Tax=Microbacterium aurantiacum TaxID=162393 RepID=A0ABT8FW39_9MICO|nr:hypothetical protein [Microbacterium aurantiacum]
MADTALGRVVRGFVVLVNGEDVAGWVAEPGDVGSAVRGPDDPAAFRDVEAAHVADVAAAAARANRRA